MYPPKVVKVVDDDPNATTNILISLLLAVRVAQDAAVDELATIVIPTDGVPLIDTLLITVALIPAEIVLLVIVCTPSEFISVPLAFATVYVLDAVIKVVRSSVLPVEVASPIPPVVYKAMFDPVGVGAEPVLNDTILDCKITHCAVPETVNTKDISSHIPLLLLVSASGNIVAGFAFT